METPDTLKPADVDAVEAQWMPSAEDYEVIAMMNSLGGQCLKLLAQSYCYGDDDMKAAIRVAMHTNGHWERYVAMIRREKRAKPAD
jgi:hypothetical protein